MGLMTNFKFWLIVGNPNPAQWSFPSWAWPANIYRLFRIGFFSPVSCNKNRRGESVLRLRGNSALGNYWCFLLARKSKSELLLLLLLLYWHTLCLFILCVVLPYFSGFWNLGSSISSLPFFILFIHIDEYDLCVWERISRVYIMWQTERYFIFVLCGTKYQPFPNTFNFQVQTITHYPYP